MNHVGILKTTHHMDNGIYLPDVGQKLVAKPLSLGGSFHQPRDIHKLDDSGGDFF